METTLKRKQIFELVIEAAALYFNLTVNDLMTGKSKKRNDSYKRHICFYLIQDNDPVLSRQFIADLFGVKAVSSIEHGQKRIKDESKIYRQTMQDITDIQELITNFRVRNQQQLSNSVCHIPANNLPQ